MSERLRLLNTTLRDGSYVINFQVTARDTAIVAGRLEVAGFELIEVGHGVGFDASERNHERVVETDEVYLAATAGAVKRAMWSMFCIPGIT